MPSCNKWINWLQKWRFNRGICSREASECPHCGVKLIWAKWPHRLSVSGCLSLILGGCLNHFYPDKTLFGFDFSLLCIYVAIALMSLGIARLKFDVVSEST